jgi:hypothetical protein
MALLSECGDIYDHISKLSTDVCFETFVVGYSFGITSLPDLLLNNPRINVIVVKQQNIPTHYSYYYE